MVNDAPPLVQGLLCLLALVIISMVGLMIAGKMDHSDGWYVFVAVCFELCLAVAHAKKAPLEGQKEEPRCE